MTAFIVTVYTVAVGAGLVVLFRRRRRDVVDEIAQRRRLRDAMERIIEADR